MNVNVGGAAAPAAPAAAAPVEAPGSVSSSQAPAAVEGPVSFSSAISALSGVSGYDEPAGEEGAKEESASGGEVDPAASVGSEAAPGGEVVPAAAEPAKPVELPAEVQAKLDRLDALDKRVTEADAQAAMARALEPDIAAIERRMEQEIASGVDPAEAEARAVAAGEALVNGYKERQQISAERAELEQLRAEKAERARLDSIAAEVKNSPDAKLFEAGGAAAQKVVADLVKTGAAPKDAVAQVAALLKAVAGGSIVEAAKERLEAGSGAPVVPGGSSGAADLAGVGGGSFSDRVKRISY